MIFLPPYSPDLNPIEVVWRKIKNSISNKYFKTADKLQELFSKVFHEIIGEKSFYENSLKKFLPTVVKIK